jgi:polysaccharide biosynthesis/export protein
MRLTKAILGYVFLIALPITAHAGQDVRPPSQNDGGYRLGPKDGLNILVWGHEELSGKFTIAADGSLSFPLIGSVKAAERTVSDLQSELSNRLADGFLKSPRVTVEIDRYVSQRVFVMGEVHTPGAVPLTGPMTLLEVLARAGSLTEQAGGDLVILRGAEQSGVGPLVAGQGGTSELGRLSVQQLRRGAVATNILLRDGDTVFVPRAENIFVLGLVNHPGPYILESGLTVLRALSLAGGTTALGSTGRIRIVRVVDGKRTEIKAQLDDLLQPGDTITVGARRF